MKKINRFMILRLVLFCAVGWSLSAVGLKKIAQFDGYSLLPKGAIFHQEASRVFFDGGNLILVGQDESFNDQYKFYFIEKSRMVQSSAALKDFTSISFSLKNFCSAMKRKNKNADCRYEGETGKNMYWQPNLWYLDREKNLGIVTIRVRDSQIPGSSSGMFLVHYNPESEKIISIDNMPGDSMLSFGLAYSHKGDLFQDEILWYFDVNANLYRANLLEKQIVKNETCGTHFSGTYKRQMKEMKEMEERTKKNLVQMPILNTVPFLSADEKFVFVADYSDKDDSQKDNPFGKTYLCELSSGQLTELPGRHTIYAATLQVPGKIFMYSNQIGEYYFIDLKTKQLSSVARSKTMGDEMVVVGPNILTFDHDYAWLESRFVGNPKQVRSYSFVALEKLTHTYSNRLIFDPNYRLGFYAHFVEDDMAPKVYIYTLSDK